jgi:predicted GH43/DUF377 family glycosyl hydrolase
MLERFKYIGIIQHVIVNGLASTPNFQNILREDTRPMPLFDTEYVTYAYISGYGEERALEVAQMYNAMLRSENVYIDNNRLTMSS